MQYGKLMKGEKKHKICFTVVKNYKLKERGKEKNYYSLYFFFKYENSDFILKHSTHVNTLYSSFIK